MEIIKAKNIGFCFGVKNAYQESLKALKKEAKCQMLGELVHNKEVVNGLKKKGILFINSPLEAKKGIVIIRAHGASKETLKILKNKKIKIIDTTCVLVKKVQKLAQELENQGRKVIIIGEKTHDEVRSIQGNLKKQALIIETESDLLKIPLNQPLGIVTQTTQDELFFKNIIKRIKKKNKDIKYYNTLCLAVLARQEEARQLSKKVDILLVIGSKNSANTQRLVQIAKKNNKKIYNVEKNIKKDWFSEVKKIGIISGTSSPDWLIERIINRIKKI